MEIFNTERLTVKKLEQKDKEYFFELLSKPEIIKPIPQKKLQEKDILQKFEKSVLIENVLDTSPCACGIFEKEDSKMIGLALFLKNDEQDYELGYRFRVEFWGKGYGTEIAKGMINYYFKELKVKKVTADANIENIGSIKILDKFMIPVKEFYNKEDKCTDRRYHIENNNWLY